MQRYLLLIPALVLTACEPLVAPEEKREPTAPPIQAEELSEGEAEASMEQELAEMTVVERLLPSGFIEIGDRDAPLVLMMFTEHHCRYCRDFHHEQFPKLHKEYIEPGRLRLQIGILPLKKYEDSTFSGKALLCAATQGKAMPMHDFLLEVGTSDRTLFMKHAEALELDTELYTACLESPDTEKTLERQRSMARTLNVTLVPTFFLDGEKSVGLPYYADLRGMIEEKLTIGN